MKISKKQKQYITAKLTKTYQNKLQFEEKKVLLQDKVIAVYQQEETKKEVLNFYNKHPEYFRMTTEYVDISQFGSTDGRWKTRYITPIRWLHCIVGRVSPNDVIKKHPELNKLAREVAHIAELSLEFELKCECVLDKINTDKRLKEEFPEAHEIYTQIVGLPEYKKNQCDSTEHLRALLSNKKTTKK